MTIHNEPRSVPTRQITRELHQKKTGSAGADIPVESLKGAERQLAKADVDGNGVITPHETSEYLRSFRANPFGSASDPFAENVSTARFEAAHPGLPLSALLLQRHDALPVGKALESARAAAPSKFSSQRTAEILGALEKSERAGSSGWKPGLPEALEGRFFESVELPRAAPDGNRYTAYVYVGRGVATGEPNLDPNEATTVYVARVGGRKDYVTLDVPLEGAKAAPAQPRRSLAEEVWKEVHGRYPDDKPTLMQRMNWEYYKLGWPE